VNWTSDTMGQTLEVYQLVASSLDPASALEGLSNEQLWHLAEWLESKQARESAISQLVAGYVTIEAKWRFVQMQRESRTARIGNAADHEKTEVIL
jgi:hypothetical protein